MKSLPFPIIDVSALFEGDNTNALTQVAIKIEEAYTTFGFAYITGHRISLDLLRSTFQAAKHFYHEPITEKLRYKIQNNGKTGFTGSSHNVYTNSNLGATGQNNYEHFRLQCPVGKQISALDESAFINENYWPNALITHRQAITQLIQQELLFLQKITQAFSVAFGLAPTGLDHYFQNIDLGFKLHYCETYNNPLPSAQWNLIPHIDYGFLTLLFTDGTPGLQVMNEEGQWKEATHLPEALILNTGEVVQRLTNNHFVASKHRVATPANCERYSTPIFLNPRPDIPLHPLKKFVVDGKRNQYSVKTYAEILAGYSKKP